MNSGRPRRIVLLTGNSLCHNPRAMKEALSLAQAGYEVRVLGAWFDASFKVRDLNLMQHIPFTFIPVLDFTSPGIGNEAARLARRVGNKAARYAFAWAGWQSALQLGYGIQRLFGEAIKSGADLYIAHSEPCLYVGRKLLRRGMRVGVDMEDWFSEDLLPEARRHRPLRLLHELETELLQRGAYASCPSQAMSIALAEECGCAPPTVVYNAFPWSERATLDGSMRDWRDRSVPSVHWYSATLGPGRGLEELLAAIALVKHEMELHLRGNPTPGFSHWVEAQVPDRLRHRVFIHALVTNAELLPRIATHDIGFAGEMKHCRSRDLTVTNKILHYLLGGLAVVASDTIGQREVASRAPEAVRLYPSGDARALADVLNSLLASPERLQRAKAAALAAAQNTFCWERQEGTLLAAVARALAQPIVAT